MFMIVGGFCFAVGVVLEPMIAGARPASSAGWDWPEACCCCCINELTAMVRLPIYSAVAERSRAYGTSLMVTGAPPATISEPLNFKRGRVSAVYISPLIGMGGGAGRGGPKGTVELPTSSAVADAANE